MTDTARMYKITRIFDDRPDIPHYKAAFGAPTLQAAKEHFRQIDLPSDPYTGPCEWELHDVHDVAHLEGGPILVFAWRRDEQGRTLPREDFA